MYLDRALSNMCDDILINVFVCLYTCQIFLYFCINLYKSCIYLYLYSKTKKYRYFCFIFLWRTLLCFCGAPLSVAHEGTVRHRIPLHRVLPTYFCGAPLHFLWRTQQGVRHRIISVAHPGRAPQKVKLSVAHPVQCATEIARQHPYTEAFCGALFLGAPQKVVRQKKKKHAPQIY